jgi:integrase
LIEFEFQKQEYVVGEDPMSVFLYALKAKETKRQYPKRLKVFFDFLGLNGPIELQAKEFINEGHRYPQWVYKCFIQFISFERERANRGEISESTISNYYKAAKLFCEMNDIIINWKRITRGLPKGRHAANDRAPYLTEIKKLLDYPDRRIKPIVYLLISSGIRIGAFDNMRWKHISSITDDKGVVVAARLIVYADEPEQYDALMTPEAFSAISKWMDYRASCGEKITGDSFIMRDIWQTTESSHGAYFGLAKYPKQLKSSGVKSLLERALRAQHIFKPLPAGAKRREWKAAHGMRKYTNTMMIKARVSSVVKEMLLGHQCGLENNYYRPSLEEDMLPEYLKAVDLLTINEENRLKRKVHDLSNKTKENEYIIKGKLEERGKEIELLKENESLNAEAIVALSDRLTKALEEIEKLKIKI